MTFLTYLHSLKLIIYNIYKMPHLNLMGFLTNAPKLELMNFEDYP